MTHEAQMTDLREAIARAIYEADPDGGYYADDPTTFWRAPDGYNPIVWDVWLRVADVVLAIARPATIEECAKVAEAYPSVWEEVDTNAAVGAIRRLTSEEIGAAIRALAEKP